MKKKFKIMQEIEENGFCRVSVLEVKRRTIKPLERDERLVFKEPYYYSKRLSDFEKVKLQFSNPAPFRRRNVYPPDR